LNRPLKSWIRDSSAPPGRAGELFRATLATVHKSTGTLFSYLFLIQYLAAVACALIWSPLSWSGSRSSVHFHVWLALILGGLLTALPVYLIRTSPAAALTRHVAAVAQMLMGSLLIHLTGGRIETHFHIFGSLAFLSFYCDTGVIATATLTLLLDHGVRGLLVPQSVYGVVTGANWRFLEHTLWALFEDIFLILACLKSRAMFAAMAWQQAQLEEGNERIEATVRARTHELGVKTEELATTRAIIETTRLKTQFLSTISHELRTPMNGVLGMTNALLASGLNDDQRECASTVLRSGEALLTIIDDILDFSKMEVGKLELARVEFRLPIEIEEIAQTLAPVAEAKHLELICELAGSLPESVAGDSGRLRQVLINLIGNAIKFTNRGEVIIRARLVDGTRNVGRIRFEVSDTGIGIREESRKTLFQPFVQVDSSATRKFEGTGLGLAISKQLVLLMGGRIGFDSAVEEGSTFWCEIPFEMLSGVAVESAGIDAIALRGLQVLIVDDNRANLVAMQRTLASWGLPAELASSGREALVALEFARARGEVIDVVLIDIGMPRVDGIDLARRIRERDVQFGSPRIVMLTTAEQLPVHKSSLAEIAATCLTKPVRRAPRYFRR
jgi:two-component system sensor histidine kinase/response regulator